MSLKKTFVTKIFFFFKFWSVNNNYFLLTHFSGSACVCVYVRKKNENSMYTYDEIRSGRNGEI